MKKPSMYIAFEGTEGSGKGVQANWLEEALIAKGHEVLFTIEPGGTRTGVAIRNILLNRKDLNIHGITEMFLFSAARAQQVRTILRPALNEGKIVISDRSFYSTLAYQGAARGNDSKAIGQMTEIAVGKTRPNIVILLDLPVEIGLERKKAQNEINRIDAEKLPFHKKVREAYLKLARQDSTTWIVIDANQSIDQVHEQILEAILPKLN